MDTIEYRSTPERDAFKRIYAIHPKISERFIVCDVTTVSIIAANEQKGIALVEDSQGTYQIPLTHLFEKESDAWGFIHEFFARNVSAAANRMEAAKAKEQEAAG